MPSTVKLKAERRLSLGYKCGLRDFQAWKQLSYLFLGSKQHIVVEKNRLMLERRIWNQESPYKDYRCTELTELNRHMQRTLTRVHISFTCPRLLREGRGYWFRGTIMSTDGISTKCQQNTWNKAFYHTKILSEHHKLSQPVTLPYPYPHQFQLRLPLRWKFCSFQNGKIHYF